MDCNDVAIRNVSVQWSINNIASTTWCGYVSVLSLKTYAIVNYCMSW